MQKKNFCVTHSRLLHYKDVSRNDNSISYNVMILTYNDMNMTITFTEHSHSSASPCLLHVVVMCLPHQHVHTEMPSSAQSAQLVINMCKIIIRYTIRNSDDE